MKKISEKKFKYLGSSFHNKWIIISVDPIDDGPGLVDQRDIYLHHFINKDNHDEILTVQECEYHRLDGRIDKLTATNKLSTTCIDEVISNLTGSLV